MLLVDETGQQPKLLLQRVNEAKVGKNRMHFDIETPTVDAEVARLEALCVMEAAATSEEDAAVKLTDGHARHRTTAAT